jgi:biotin transport system substrate-specific component
MNRTTRNQSTRRIAETALFAALTAAAGFIRIPLVPVPITLQTFVVYLSGDLLGPRSGTASQILFLVLGLIGLPLFTGGGGIAYALNPAFGYLAAFPLGAWIVGHSHNKSLSIRMMAYALSVMAILTVGATVLYANLRWIAGKPVSILWIVTSGFLLFLPGEALKAGAAMWLSGRIRGAARYG